MTTAEPIFKSFERWWHAVALLMPSPAKAQSKVRLVRDEPLERALALDLRTREMAPGEEGLLADLYVASVRELGLAAYSEEQVATWSSFGLHFAEFRARLSGGLVQVALDAEGIAGFCQLETDGHLALLYTAPRVARQGVATRIYQDVEAHARRFNLRRLYTEASHLSRPFFAKQGFRVIEPETVERKGVKFERFRMEKRLD